MLPPNNGGSLNFIKLNDSRSLTIDQLQYNDSGSVPQPVLTKSDHWEKQQWQQ